MNKKIVVIGNGAAGNAAVEEILANEKDCKIIQITNEYSPIYYRPMLSEYISEKEVPKRFYLHDEEWYKENKIDFLKKANVGKILPDEKRIELATGESIDYDALILAMGSYNFMPPMPGSDKKKVVSLRTLEDADKIKAMAEDAHRAVIIGGGLLGLELGWQLVKLGIEVSVLEMMNRLLPRQLDEEASVLFEEKVKAAGINVLKGVKTQQITGNQSAEGVELTDGTVVPADFVIFSIGVRANAQVAKEAGLKTERGIVVDSAMRTSDPNIFAAGDCAEFEGINYAIWPEAIAQGKVAGLGAIGKEAAYETLVPFNLYHGMNMRLFSIGDVGGNPDKTYDVEKAIEGDRFEKFFFSDGKLVGGILLGDISKSSKLKRALAEGQTKEDFLASL
ncbi:MAG: hypothetical protein PWQ12_1959 [Clostridiales bacterium]|jgi:nitrite reductase (NADH) large subunit|nr:hypothetical protein [Clostridiales bacterium]